MNRKIEFHPGSWLERVRFERHWDLYSGGSLERTSGAVYADIRAVRLPRMTFERGLGGIPQHRDPKRVAPDDFTRLPLQAELGSITTVAVQSGKALVGAGAASLRQSEAVTGISYAELFEDIDRSIQRENLFDSNGRRPPACGRRAHWSR
jgi:hypothetical protein